MRIGAAKTDAGRAFGFVQIQIPAAGQPVTRESFRFSVDKTKLKDAALRDGHYLLRSNLTDADPAVLWTRYVQLTPIESVIRSCEDALFRSKASAPRFHQSNGSAARAEPSRRSGNTLGFCVTGGSRRLLRSQPRRLGFGQPRRRDPAKLCEHYDRVQQLDPKTGTFYLAGNRNFLFGSDI